MRPSGIEKRQPIVQVVLQLVQRQIYPLAEGGLDAFLLDGSVKALDKATGLRATYLGGAVLEVVEVEVNLEGMGVGAAVLPNLLQRVPQCLVTNFSTSSKMGSSAGMSASSATSE